MCQPKPWKVSPIRASEGSREPDLRSQAAIEYSEVCKQLEALTRQAELLGERLREAPSSGAYGLSEFETPPTTSEIQALADRIQAATQRKAYLAAMLQEFGLDPEE